MIRKSVKIVYPGLFRKEQTDYSCRSIRVWAYVSLDEATLSPDFIKKRLGRLGESYWVYVRDTHKINVLHNAVLVKSTQHAMELIKLIHENNSDQSFEKNAHELGKYEHEY